MGNTPGGTNFKAFMAFIRNINKFIARKNNKLSMYFRKCNPSMLLLREAIVKEGIEGEEMFEVEWPSG